MPQRRSDIDYPTGASLFLMSQFYMTSSEILMNNRNAPHFTPENKTHFSFCLLENQNTDRSDYFLLLLELPAAAGFKSLVKPVSFQRLVGFLHVVMKEQ